MQKKLGNLFRTLNRSDY